MGTKMAVAFGNIFMSAVETEIINKSPHKPLVWKRFIDDIFSLWNVDKEQIDSFIELANNHHPTIKFTAEVSETETAFLDTCIYKGEKFKKESILDVRTHLKPTSWNTLEKKAKSVLTFLPKLKPLYANSTIREHKRSEDVV